MADDKKEPWLNWLALLTVLLAACATFATFKGGGYSTKSLLAQTQASDQWAFYQSKSLKGYLSEMERDMMKLQLGVASSATTNVAAAWQPRLDDLEKRIKRYEDERKKIETEAHALEKLRDNNGAHGRQFGIAVIYLQLAILLSSIAALLKKKPVWFLGLAFGAVGVVFFANGFYLFWP